jgi:uncharacterized protein YbbK (DUF523 family)
MEGRLLPLCPEVLGGLPVPRPPAEIAGGDGHAVVERAAVVGDSTGADVTEAFLLGGRRTVESALAHDVRVAVLKDGSPSCATSYVHDGTFRGQRGPGRGVAAALLAQAGIRVFSERQLEEAAACLAALEEAGPRRG